MFAVVLALGACKGGHDKLDRARVDAIVHRADACTDVACAEAANEEMGKVFAEFGNTKNGLAEEDTKYMLDAGSLIRDKIARLKAGK